MRCVCRCVCVCVCYTTVASKGIISVGFMEFPFNQKGMSWTFSRDVFLLFFLCCFAVVVFRS